MASLDSFMSRLMVWVPSCPQPLAAQSLLDTAIDFCRETGIMRASVGPLSVQYGNADYLPSLPHNTRILRVVSATYRGAPLTPTHEEVLDGAIGTPRQISCPDSSTVRLYPAPDETETSVLRLSVVLVPKAGATLIPDPLYDEWLDAIVAGAAARICAIPDQPFTNPMVAAEATMRYRQQLTRAKAEAAGPRLVTNARVRPHPLA